MQSPRADPARCELRPVRDQLGGAVGAVALPWFYAATFVVTLGLTPVFGGLAARSEDQVPEALPLSRRRTQPTI